MHQHPLSLQVRPQSLEGGLTRLLSNAERDGDRRRHQLVSHCSEERKAEYTPSS